MLNSRMIGEDAIQQYLGGELPQSDVAAVESALRQDPGLAARVQSLQRQNKQLHGLCAGILQEPVPEHLISILRDTEPAAKRHSKAHSLPRFFTAPSRGSWRGRVITGRRIRETWAVLLALLIGIGIGWIAHGAPTSFAGHPQGLGDSRCAAPILDGQFAASAPLCCGTHC
jgi:anti-sigma factor RsiW